MNLVNIKVKPKPAYDLYIGRANKHLDLPESKWANPYPLKKESDRPRVVQNYLDYLLARPNLILDLHEIDGKILGCYCAPKRCHGEVLRELRELQMRGLLQVVPKPGKHSEVVIYPTQFLSETSILRWLENNEPRP